MTAGYAPVNGIKMYYEIHGEGEPLILVHGGGSTIETSFSDLLPLLSPHFMCIAVETQAHGRSSDRDAWQTFSQDADDIAAMMDHLSLEQASLLGFSNGGHDLIEFALRHPHRIHKLILASSPAQRKGFFSGFFDGFEDAQLDSMPKELQEGFLKVNNSRENLLRMFNHDVNRMKNFAGWTDEQLQQITAPTLILSGDQDVGSSAHMVKMASLVSGARLCIMPAGHDLFFGQNHPLLPEACALIVRGFLQN